METFVRFTGVYCLVICLVVGDNSKAKAPWTTDEDLKLAAAVQVCDCCLRNICICSDMDAERMCPRKHHLCVCVDVLINAWFIC